MNATIDKQEQMKLRFKLKADDKIPVIKPLWLKVVGNNELEVDTLDKLFKEKQTVAKIRKAVKILLPTSEEIKAK